jgi:hypothetical protein
MMRDRLYHSADTFSLKRTRRASEPCRDARLRRVRLVALVAVAGLAHIAGAELSSSAVLDRPPRVSDLTVRLGAVPVQGGGRKRGVKGTYRLCDDGPSANSRRSGVEEITHRWSTRTGTDVMLLVRERHPSISWDIYFRRAECRSRIAWHSTIPAEVAVARSYPCYSVSLRVRDPGGSWSRYATRVVRRCS